MRTELRGAGFIMATTLGAGIFALPYVFQETGFAMGAILLAVLAVVIIYSHFLYWKSLRASHEHPRLLGLAHAKGGRAFGSAAFVAIAGGLLLTLIAYLILAGRFVALFAPGIGEVNGVLLFWFFSSLLLLFRLRWFEKIELFGAIVIVLLIFILSFGALGGQSHGVAASSPAPFAAFGAILFALAGWTAIEPIFAAERNASMRRKPLVMLAMGTGAVAVLYLFFVRAIWMSAPVIAQDTISGLLGWPFWKLATIGALGVFALWTSYVPISLSLAHTLEEDMKHHRKMSFALVVLLPLLIVLAGVHDFLPVIGFAGGIFLALQYLIILFVSMKTLRLKGAARAGALLAAGVFALGILWQIFYFIGG